MWTRKMLKDQAKEALRRNYWKIVLVSLILMVINGGMPSASAGGSNNNGNRSRNESFEDLSDVSLNTAARSAQTAEKVARSFVDNIDPVVAAAYMTVFVIVLVVFWIVIGLLDIFLLNPLQVGVQRFMVISVDDRANISEITYAFDPHYKNVVRTVFEKELRIVLWSFLFIIPGIYKKYQYYMVNYILSERPDMPYKEALDLSRQMMDGEKWNTFVLEFSFILWSFLSVMTCGIVGIFYVRPYRELTKAALYRALCQRPQPMGYVQM